jgi:hypothetical protein
MGWGSAAQRLESSLRRDTDPLPASPFQGEVKKDAVTPASSAVLNCRQRDPAGIASASRQTKPDSRWFLPAMTWGEPVPGNLQYRGPRYSRHSGAQEIVQMHDADRLAVIDDEQRGDFR